MSRNSQQYRRAVGQVLIGVGFVLFAGFVLLLAYLGYW